jgi:hypothetical protein
VSEYSLKSSAESQSELESESIIVAIDVLKKPRCGPAESGAFKY